MRLAVLKNHVPINDVLVETPDFDEKYEIYVGRSEDCHILIEDPLISRHHLVLKNQDGRWFCEKLSQLGIVTVNGLTSPKMEIKNGDEIKCGTYSLLVSDLPQSSTQAAPETLQPLFAQQQKEEMPDLETQMLEAEPISSPEPETELVPEPEQEQEVEPQLEESLELGDVQLDEPMADNLEVDLSMGDDAFVENAPENDLPANDFSIEDGNGLDLDANSESVFEDQDSMGSDESTKFFKAFINYQLVLFGEHAPYDRYQIDNDEIYIGRDIKKCQIILNDPEVSTVHAVIRKNNIDITLEDLNSSNGTILNGERINRAHLATGDEFVIGSTSFTLETRSDLLEAEADRLMPVESGQTIEKEEIEEEIVDLEDEEGVNFNSDAPQEKSIIKRVWKNPQQRKKLLYGLVVGALLLTLMKPEEENVPDMNQNKKNVAVAEAKKDVKPKVILSKELEQKRNMAYELGVSFFEQYKLDDALREFQIVAQIDPTYKRVDAFLDQTEAGLKRLEELEAQKRAEEERIKTKKIIEELMVKAREAVKEKQVTVAENYFSQIIGKDPENIEVQQLKMELDAWKKEKERLALEKAAKDAARKAMVDALSPGKTFYLKKEWYRAILKLEDFLRRKGSDEDLVKEASDMLSDAKDQLASELGPLIGKARSLKEGQDLKSAFEAYLEVLKVEPTNAEALNEVDEIKSLLENRSKRIYREAIIAESLSLFNDAKEKFQEVQQISPTDSEYYRKASDKLESYLE